VVFTPPLFVLMFLLLPLHATFTLLLAFSAMHATQQVRSKEKGDPGMTFVYPSEVSGSFP
jgi:hypothetical protein